MGLNSLITKISEKFVPENKIIETKFSVSGEDFSLFYIESMINKQLFSAGLLSPIEKFVKENQNKTNTNSEKNQTENQDSQNNQNSQNCQNNQISQNSQNAQNGDLCSKIKKLIVAISAVEELTDENQIEQKIFSGFACVVFKDKALAFPLFGAEKRGIEEPPTARVVKGPREGFVEDIATNIGLIRKRMRTRDLKIKDLFIGERSHTQVSLVYIEGVAKQEIVEEVIKRLSKINIDAIIDSYYIESFLEADKLKFFRRVGNTEKPDIFVSKILEGRVGIVVDGSPVALSVPFVLLEDLQSPEDYYTIPAQATFVRFMRFAGLILAILIPGVYVALQSFNYRILPINFLITLLSSIEGLSVPPLIEILLVLLLFEVITEASLQMPNSLGMALSIIGALALGNTAVDAGIISPPSVVLVAISSVALYIIPDQIAETRLLRILFTLIGGIIGLYGIITGLIILTTYLTSITSFGVPYLSPFAPHIKGDQKDAFVKKSIEEMNKRPILFAGENATRQGDENDKNTKLKKSSEQKLKQKNMKKIQDLFIEKNQEKSFLKEDSSNTNQTKTQKTASKQEGD